MAIKNVNYVKAKDLTKEQKAELGLDENLNMGIVAIESHNSVYMQKGVVIKRGISNYILNGN